MRGIPFDSNRFNPQPKPEKKQKPAYSLKKSYKKKPTGELVLFQEIWLERKHICEHCGDPIEEFSVSNFDHILTKKQRSDLRLDKTNIRLICFDCHFIRHNGTKDQFEKRKLK